MGAFSGDSPKLTHCCIPDAGKVDSGVALQLGPSEVAVHSNLPVALGVHPDVVHGCDILHASQPHSERTVVNHLYHAVANVTTLDL